MNLEQYIESLAESEGDSIRKILEVPAKEASFAPIPQEVDNRLKAALKERGIEKLYSHQNSAFMLYQEGKDFVVTTPTASGKTLCYLLPILAAKLKNPKGKHLFMFPTKALAQDQLAAYRSYANNLNATWNINTFDGDTPEEERRQVRKAGDFILTNPDMLHSGILPHHSIWKSFFENLETIVIDEMHTYIGVFGSHVANVLRRLNRICAHYGSRPRYIFCSATIGNPEELAEKLAERTFTAITQSGASEGKKYFLFYKPRFFDSLQISESPYKAAARLGAGLIQNSIATIFFARSRNRVELLTQFLRKRLPEHLRRQVRTYRGGFLPLERRHVERSLREGTTLGVVSTNALELGIDIGSLNAVVSVGYPGRLSSLFQQFGRAGRQKEPSLAILVASPSALDQYLLRNTNYIFETKGEAAIVNPDNLLIYQDQLKCAAYELRFSVGEKFGAFPVDPFLEGLVTERILLERDGGYFWTSQTYPASNVSLRSAATDNFVIVDKTSPGNEKVIGEIDYFSAPLFIHDEAIYMHGTKHFYVEKLIWEERRAEVKEVKSDYYTDAHEKVHKSILHIEETASNALGNLNWGEVTLRRQAYLYKKIKIETSENLGWGHIHTPEIEMHTQGAWIDLNNNFFTEIPETLQSTLLTRLAYLLRQLAPLIALCDSRDLSISAGFKDVAFGEHAIIFHDNYPGGVGLSYKLASNIEALFRLSFQAVTGCSCQSGCPSCIGVWDSEEEQKASEKSTENLKSLVMQLLKNMLAVFTPT
ncbi:MAG: ATP-dependent RNA helicase SrmB [Turneriella sp.]|nr:ATP-dependent RNA helicase SrmB [Turneriella sp.]